MASKYGGEIIILWNAPFEFSHSLPDRQLQLVHIRLNGESQPCWGIWNVVDSTSAMIVDQKS